MEKEEAIKITIKTGITEAGENVMIKEIGEVGNYHSKKVQITTKTLLKRLHNNLIENRLMRNK